MKDFHTAPDPAFPPGREKIKSIRERESFLFGSIDGDGWVRFLNVAWEDVLGCHARIAAEQPLRELIPLERAAADRLVNRLLDPTSPDPVEIDLKARSGARRRYLWHRRFDSQEQKMYIAGVEITEPENGQ
jgi:PAS domain-containing protein